MATSMIVWQCITIFCYILQPVCTGTTHISRACYGAPGVSCARHDISCSSTQKIAICDAYYTDNNECGIAIANCIVNPDNVAERGYHRFSKTELVPLYNNCSTQTQCVYPAPRRNEAPIFSVVKYQCIQKGDLLNISEGSAQGLSVVSLIHDQRRHSSLIHGNNYMCSFTPNTTATSISVYALDVRLRRRPPGQCLSNLSVLPGKVIRMNDCSSVFQPFETLNVTEELPTFLYFSDITSQLTVLWLLINASDPFNVTCGAVTGTGTSAGTTVSRISPTDVNSSISTGGTGAIVGGVVATVLAVLFVTFLSVMFIRKRRAKGEVKEKTASRPLDLEPDKTYILAGKIPKDNYHEIQDLKTQNSDYDYATADGMAPNTNANTYFKIEPAGKQNEKQFPKASTIESDYDHIGDKSSPQTSDYDTTASVAQPAHTGGTIGEDDYGYNLFQTKTNPQTHQNDYDTAASATKAVAQMSRTDGNTHDDDYDHFPRATNDAETVSSPYVTASGMEDTSDYSVAGQIK